jgi:hypothetical protein
MFVPAAFDFTEQLTAWATALAAIGTVGTLAAALIQFRREWAARARQEKRAQAERVSAWVGELDPLPEHGSIEDQRQKLELLNASAEPVYRAVVYLVFVQGTGPKTGRAQEEHFFRTGNPFRRMLSVIPPGRYYTDVGGGWMHLAARPAVELAFTDRAGIHWLRASDGSLTEIDQSPTAYYRVGAPFDWSVPEPRRGPAAEPNLP